MKKITINAEGFIIPNKNRRIGEWRIPGMKETRLRLARVNGVEANDWTEMIEMWFHNKENQNIQDHGLYVNREIIFGPGAISPMWPAELFKDAKEGDTVTIKQIVKKQILKELEDDEEDFPIEEYDVTINLTCKQRGYRYGQRSFEDTFAMVSLG